MMNELVDRR